MDGLQYNVRYTTRNLFTFSSVMRVAVVQARCYNGACQTVDSIDVDAMQYVTQAADVKVAQPLKHTRHVIIECQVVVDGDTQNSGLFQST